MEGLPTRLHLPGTNPLTGLPRQGAEGGVRNVTPHYSTTLCVTFGGTPSVENAKIQWVYGPWAHISGGLFFEGLPRTTPSHLLLLGDGSSYLFFIRTRGLGYVMEFPNDTVSPVL